MSTQTYLRAGAALAALTTLAFATTANAGSSRYGSAHSYESGANCGSACVPGGAMALPVPAYNPHDVYRYESGRNCGSACVPPQAMITDTRYGGSVVESYPMPIAQEPIYIDCTQTGTCAPQVFSDPVPMAQSFPRTSTVAADCPSGTVMQTDGTCMQSASGSVRIPTNYGAVTSAQSFTSMSTADCPSGTTMQSDGTCMQSASGSVRIPTNYGAVTSAQSFTSSSSVECPSGTSLQSDGTCMQSASGSVRIPTNYGATTTAPAMSYSTTNCPSGTVMQSDGTCMQSGSSSVGYQSSSSYSSSSYLPIRK